ncbi:hypothetical protein SCUCBS95973_009372 [Sporothrix curviconia]|uniref:C2H2-type domain-containing protein n=1 Tax=Sporothrix curviconia TaxID=1260050 RepID=A0ABP0CUF3_9PEZI
MFSGGVTPSPEPAPEAHLSGPRKRCASSSEDNNSDKECPDKKKRVVFEFACPFFKRNRDKEHLYRHHMHYVCERCSATFKAPGNLKKHLRQPVACSVSPFKVPEDAGFDSETEKKLRSRKKIDGQTEVEKWDHMFQLLFPNASAHRTPSPFVDYSLKEDSYPPGGETEEALLHPDSRQFKEFNSNSPGLEAIANVAVAAEQQMSAAENRGIVSANMTVALPVLMASNDRVARRAHVSEDELHSCQMVSQTDLYEIVRDHVRTALTAMSTLPSP